MKASETSRSEALAFGIAPWIPFIENVLWIAVVSQHWVCSACHAWTLYWVVFLSELLLCYSCVVSANNGEGLFARQLRTPVGDDDCWEFREIFTIRVCWIKAYELILSATNEKSCNKGETRACGRGVKEFLFRFFKFCNSSTIPSWVAEKSKEDLSCTLEQCHFQWTCRDRGSTQQRRCCLRCLCLSARIRDPV